jgi:ATP-binding cassette subfamily A (ABC1) protein 5
MRRRLSVALAFAGNPEHVILDEPTAGVDPRARRQIQSFLQKKSKGKAVLVTTHHLDEAERLGTRVAILHQGILVASGSSEALKKKYDVGYSVVVTLLETRAREKESIAETLLRLFRGKVFKGNEPGEPDARATTVTREGAEAFGEVSFSWPGSLASSLPAALRELDARKTELGVAGYGLGSPSLDGVFRAVQRERGGRGDRNEGFAAQDRGQADAADAVDVVDAADAAATATADVSRDVVEIAPRAVGLPDGKTLFRKIGENGWNAPRSNWWTTVFAVANASLRAFARDRSRILATCVAPAVLLLLASGMAGFQPSSSTYGTSTHVPVSGNPKAYVFSCPTPSAAAAAVESRGAFLERDLASVASFAAERVPEQSVASSSFFDHDDATATANATVSSSAAACHAEESVWARFYGLHPSGLRGRRETEAVGVALGSGGVATATTVWWSSFRLRRAALAAVARAEALARFESVSFESSEASATASAAVSAVAERGGFRPWPKTDAQTRRALLSAAPGPATAAAAALLAIAMPPCLVAAAAAKDRASGLRRVLLVAGASKSAHWVGVLVSDLAVLIPSCLAQAVALGAAGWNALGGVDGASAVAALLFVNSIASLGVAHAVSLWIGEENAYKTFSTCLLVASVPATFLAGATYASDAVGDVQGAEVFFWIGKLFPGYATAQGVIETALKHAMRYERSVGVQNGKPFERLRGALLMASYEPRGDGVEGLLRFSLGIGVVSFLCAGSVDGLFDWTIRGARGGVRRERRKGKDDPETPDADVVAEETRLKALYFPRPGDSGSRITVFEDLESGVAGSRTDHSESESEREPDALRVFGLRKSYAGSSRPAVSNLWLGVKPGECFGLLGINGCGKTTTFRMCAGDLRPSGGRVEIGNSNQDSRTGAVGYCPQKDSIVASLTVYEHVSLVAAARGFARDDGHRFVSSAIAEAGLRSFSGTRAGSLSGGNKRKLCLAMALFGLRRNGLALLDEPTAGIDPAARASITALIRRTAKEKSTACVITSHAVEDIGALCDRVGVMVDGALRCLGAPQRLRSRHGKHLTLTIHTSAARSQTTRSEETNRARALDAFVTSVAPGARRSVVGAGAGAGAEGGSLSVSSGPEPPSSDSPARSDEAAAAARAFGFIENDDCLRTARRIASEGALRSEAVIGASSPSWELPASRVASLPDILEALEKRKALSFAERRLRDGASPGAETEPFDIEGYAVGQASLEDVFLEFASRGIAQSDAQMMAMEDALFAHRLALSKKKE